MLESKNTFVRDLLHGKAKLKPDPITQKILLVMPNKRQASVKDGLQFSRRFTRKDVNVFELFEYDYRTSVIRNPSGEVVFEMNNVEVPKQWSQIATDILAQKYFRKAGGPQPDVSS